MCWFCIAKWIHKKDSHTTQSILMIFYNHIIQRTFLRMQHLCSRQVHISNISWAHVCPTMQYFSHNLCSISYETLFLDLNARARKARHHQKSDCLHVSRDQLRLTQHASTLAIKNICQGPCHLIPLKPFMLVVYLPMSWMTLVPVFKHLEGFVVLSQCLPRLL